MKVAALFLHQDVTPPRVVYEGFSEQEKIRVETTLSRYGVETFQGFNYWDLRKRDFDGKIMIRRFTWEIPSWADNIDGLVSFLNEYHLPRKNSPSVPSQAQGN